MTDNISDNILKITFNAHTVNGSIIQSKNYTPSMSNPQYVSFPNILFIPSIKITKKLFQSNLGEDDIKKIFLSPTQLNNFITRLNEKKMYKPITISEAKTKGIIVNNIKFILDLFFVKGNNFYLNNNTFIVNNYTWNNKYNLDYSSGKKTPVVSINIDLFLHKGQKLSFIDSTKITCSQKRQQIIKDYYELVNLNKSSSKTAPYSDIPVDNTKSAKSAKPAK